MIKHWLKGVAIAALTAAGAVAAQAADLPTRKEAPAPVFVPPPFTWTGFYIGVNAGAVWGSGHVSSQLFASGFPVLSTEWPGGTFGGSQTGFIGGGQAGYNWQTGAFVLGAETDFDWTSLSRHSNFVGATFFDPFGRSDFLTENGSRRLDWLGTTRARVGYTGFWDSRLMIYATGGVAYGGGSSHFDVFDNRDGWDWNGGGGSNTRVGWTLGGGVEYAFTNNITLKGEYLYYDLGSTHSVIIANPLASTFFPNTYATAKINFNGSIARLGLNYKF